MAEGKPAPRAPASVPPPAIRGRRNEPWFITLDPGTLMNGSPDITVFFDIATTLAFVELTADGDHLGTFTVYPGVAEILQKIAGKGVRLGILSDRGRISEDEMRFALRTSALAPLYDQLVVVFGRTTSPGTFTRAVTRIREIAGREGTQLVYVSDDPSATANARKANFLTADHPRLLAALREGAQFVYLRIGVPAALLGQNWPGLLRGQPLVPLHVTAVESAKEPIAVFAVADSQTAAELEALHFSVQQLGFPGDPQTSEAYLVQGELKPEPALPPATAPVLVEARTGNLVAVAHGQPVSAFRFTDRGEGNLRKLTPSVMLLEGRSTVAPRASTLSVAAAGHPLSGCERAILASHFCPEFMQRTVARYAGTAPDETGNRILSRHVDHPGNELAVETLVTELDEIAPGVLKVRRHCFVHDQRMLTNVVATLPAAGLEGIVVISAHLDSTAQNEDFYCSATSMAPGADDDASGMAAVLAAARALVDLARLDDRPRREVRFAFFNAEEDGMAGSRTYAHAQAALGTPVTALFHVDMIGYDGKPPAEFEIHAGFSTLNAPHAASAKDRSSELGLLLQDLREAVKCLPQPDLITDFHDEGGGRSDHTNFHELGYPACFVTEDFFANHGAEGDINPHYHTSKDREINPNYAADIARLVGAAAWIAATR